MSWVKDPDAVLDYGVDWSQWLEDGETLSSSDWLVPSGIDEESTENTTTTATIWLSGGTAGSTYSVTNRVTTSGGRTDDRTLKIRVANR